VSFKEVIASDHEYALSLFRYATVRLLAHKYAYYVLNGNYISDMGYDIEERDWFMMGRMLGQLAPDETSPCIDFDVNHPLAAEAIAYAGTLTLRND
jgi:hypothetical protein